MSPISRRATANAPARPVAAAATRSTTVGETRAAIWLLSSRSLICGSSTDSPAPRAITTAVAASTIAVQRASARGSPYEIATAIPWIGVASGAMIIAPITVAVESPTTPAVAITAARRSSSQNRVCLAATSPVVGYTASRISAPVRLSRSRLAVMLATRDIYGRRLQSKIVSQSRRMLTTSHPSRAATSVIDSSSTNVAAVLSYANSRSGSS